MSIHAGPFRVRAEENGNGRKRYVVDYWLEMPAWTGRESCWSPLYYFHTRWGAEGFVRRRSWKTTGTTLERSEV